MCQRHLLDKIKASLLLWRVIQSSNSALLTALFLRSVILTPTTSCVVVVYTWIYYCGLLERLLKIQDLSGPSPIVKISPAIVGHQIHCKVDFSVFCSNVEFEGGGFSRLKPGFQHCLQILKCWAICKRGQYWSRRLNPLTRATQNLAILISSTSAPLISPSPIDHRLTCATDVQNIQRCSN